jgi:hypothetical protein
MVFPQNQKRGRGGDGMVKKGKEKIVHLFTPQFGEGKVISFERTEEDQIVIEANISHLKKNNNVTHTIHRHSQHLGSFCKVEEDTEQLSF